MRIIEVRMENYKSIKDSGVLQLDHLTVLAGRNSTGKTALIEGIAKFFSDSNHTPAQLTSRITQETPACLEIEIQP